MRVSSHSDMTRVFLPYEDCVSVRQRQALCRRILRCAESRQMPVGLRGRWRATSAERVQTRAVIRP